MVALWASAHTFSTPECRKQLAGPLIVGVVRGEMRTNILDSRSVFVGTSQSIEDLLGSTAGQSQLATGRSIDELSMILVEHQKRDCVRAEDLEIFQGQMLQVAQERALSENIYARRAHRFYDVIVHHSSGRLDPQSLECVRIREEGLGGPGGRPFGGRLVPPQAEKANFTHLIA